MAELEGGEGGDRPPLPKPEKQKTYFYKTTKYVRKTHTLKLIFIVKVFATRTQSKE